MMFVNCYKNRKSEGESLSTSQNYCVEPSIRSTKLSKLYYENGWFYCAGKAKFQNWTIENFIR